MKWPIILLAGLATAAVAKEGTDYPHRDWGQVATLDMSLTDAVGCIARTMDRRGSVLVLPVEGGSDIDYSAQAMFGGSVGEPWIRFKVRPVEGLAELRVFYRHPVSQKAIGKHLRDLEKQCLKVTKIAPA